MLSGSVGVFPYIPRVFESTADVIALYQHEMEAVVKVVLYEKAICQNYI